MLYSVTIYYLLYGQECWLNLPFFQNFSDAQCQELLACTLCEMLNMVEENEVILVFLKDNAHTFSTICADGSNLSTASSGMEQYTPYMNIGS